MTISEEENKLFEKWKYSISSNEKFAKDGIADEIQYNNAKYKILFLAKETNKTGEEWDTRDYLNNGVFYKSTGKPISKTFNNIYRWANLFLNNIDNIKDYKKVPKDKTARQNIFQKIGMMNLKKTTGTATTNYNKFNEFVNNKNNQHFLKKQISLYNPNIIICCGRGVYGNLKKIIDNVENENKLNGKFRTSNLIINDNKIILIDFYHPQSRTKIKEQFSILQNIKKQYKL